MVFDKTTITILLKICYDLEGIQCKQMRDNVMQATLLVHDETKHYVLKVFASKAEANRLAVFQDYLYKSGLCVPEVIKTTSGQLMASSGKYAFVLIAYIDGESIGWSDKTKNLDAALVASMAEVVSRMHTVALLGVEESGLSEIRDDQSVSPHGLDARKVGVSGLRKTFIHGDLTRENIVVTPSFDAVKGIIDFGDTIYGYIAYDVAVLLTQVFVTKSWGIDFVGINQFMLSYQIKSPLMTVELDALIPFMVFKNEQLLGEMSNILKSTHEIDLDAASIFESAKKKIELIKENKPRLRQLLSDN